MLLRFDQGTGVKPVRQTLRRSIMAIIAAAVTGVVVALCGCSAGADAGKYPVVTSPGETTPASVSVYLNVEKTEHLGVERTDPVIRVVYLESEVEAGTTRTLTIKLLWNSARGIKPLDSWNLTMTDATTALKSAKLVAGASPPGSYSVTFESDATGPDGTPYDSDLAIEYTFLDGAIIGAGPADFSGLDDLPDT